jgi:carotenoid cleavage dioxygenase-like enzyme
MARSFATCNQEKWNNASLFNSTEECNDQIELVFNEKLPKWLKGCLYRNGPGQYELNNNPDTSVNHPFDGFAYIQKYNIDGEKNTIHFQSSFIKSRTYKESVKHRKLITRQFGTDPCKRIFGRFQLLFSPLNPQTYPDDPSVTIQRVNNELLALTETVTGYIIDEKTLETVAPLTSLPFTKPMKTEILTLTTAHVMYNPKRKMTISYATRMTRSHGQWLDVIFIFDDDVNHSNDDKESSKTSKYSLSINDHFEVSFNNNRMFFLLDVNKRHRNDSDDDDDENVDEGRFILITNNMNERGKKYNQLIKSKTKSFRFNYDHSACYMHSASITEDYLILSEIPLNFSLFNTIRTILNGKLLTNMFKWNGSLPTYFRIISLDDGKEIARIPGPAFFTFHHINAYQINEAQADKIVIDICAYDDHRLVDELYLDKLRQNIFPSGLGYIRRFHLNLNTKQCTEPHENFHELSNDQQVAYPISYKNSVVPVQIDLPRINPNHIGKFYRYIYAVRGPPNYFMDALVKIDVENHQISGFWQEPCTSPSEPVFVPKTEPTQEDDGIVLTIVFEQQTNKSFILLLDGMTFKEITRAYLPIQIPFSLHGNFY